MSYEAFEAMGTDVSKGYELDWEGSIEKDGEDFTLLPAGDYDFEVVSVERGRHNGSKKLPPCNKVIVNIRVKGPEGTSTIKHNLFLHSITEGMLCAFFAGVGMRKKGEKFNMDFPGSVGAKGRCKVGVRAFTRDDGVKLEFNEIKKFYEPKPSYSPPSETPNFTPGVFG